MADDYPGDDPRWAWRSNVDAPQPDGEIGPSSRTWIPVDLASRTARNLNRPVDAVTLGLSAGVDPLELISKGASPDEVYGRDPGVLDRILGSTGGQQLMFLANFLGPKVRFPEPAFAPPLDGPGPSPRLSRPKGREAVKSGRGSEEAMLEGARKGSHLKRKPDGKYVGAPDAVTSPQALARMRKELDRLVDEGEIGSDWYSKGRSAVSEITGNDPVANDIWANTIGIMSPQSKPDPNLGTAIRGLGHYAVTGDVPPIVRTGAQADAIREQIATGGHSSKGLGRKTAVFADTLNPNKEGQFHGSTNDIWHARGFGYKDTDGGAYSGSPSPQMHAFMDNETALAGIRAAERGLDVSIPDVQARVWFAKKIEDAIASGLSREEAIAKVKAESGSFADYLDKYTTYGTHEFKPGGATGHLAGMDDIPGLSVAYHDHPATTWMDPTGRDALYTAIDPLMPVRPTLKMQGAWEDPVKGFQTNPGEAARPMFPLVAGPGGTHLVDPVLAPTITGAEALRAYLGAQSGAATHRLGAGQAGQLNAVDVPMSRPLTADEIVGLSKSVGERGYNVSDRGNGATIVDFMGEKGAADLKRDFPGILGDVKSTIPDAGVPIRRSFSSTYGDLDFSQPGSGSATRTMLEAVDAMPAKAREGVSRSPVLRQRADAMANRDEIIGGIHGVPLREDIQRARRIFAVEGLDGIRKAVARGEVLPAVAAAVVTGGVAATQGGDQEVEE